MPAFPIKITTTTGRSERGLGLLWTVSAVSALVLCLAVNGTLSSWTSAVLAHNNNTAATLSTARVLQVDGPDSSGAATTCSSATDASNSATCSINLFGANGVPQTSMAPGSTNTTIVTVTNTGDTSGTLKLTPSSCTSSGSLCSQLTITVACVGLGTIVATPTTLSTFASGGLISAGALAAGTSSICTFVTTLPVLATAWSGQTAAQTITWSLTA